MLLWETGAVGELTTDDGAVPGQSFFRIAPQGGHLGQAAVEFVRDQLSPLLARRPICATRWPTSTTPTGGPWAWGPSTRWNGAAG